MPTPRPHSIVYPSPAKARAMYADGDTGDIIRVIMYADRRSGDFIRPEASRRLQGPDQYHTLKNIYWFVKRNVEYNPDTPGHEVVRSPGYLFDTATGDCKSLSIAIGAICRAFGIPYCYRFIRQGGRRNFHHVYVVAFPTDGSAIGPVLLDAVHRTFDSEPSHSAKLDLKPGQRPPASLAGIMDNGNWILPAALLLWLLFAKKIK